MTVATVERSCAGCGVDISHKRPQAKTCGKPRCWKRCQRAREQHAALHVTAAAPSRLTDAEIRREVDFDDLTKLIATNGADAVRLPGWVIA